MDVSTISIPILALSSDQCLQANKSCEKSKDALVLSKSNDDGGEYSMMLRGRQQSALLLSGCLHSAFLPPPAPPALRARLGCSARSFGVCGI